MPLQRANTESKCVSEKTRDQVGRQISGWESWDPKDDTTDHRRRQKKKKKSHGEISQASGRTN